MATFYTGYRHVLRGRNSNNSGRYLTGTPGTYSYYGLTNSDQVLEGFPNTNYPVGTERPYNYIGFMEYLYGGGHHLAPMRNSGGGPRVEGARFRPLEYKGTAGSAVFHNHTQVTTDYALYSNFIYDGLESAEALKDPGHAIRYDAAWGGPHRPYIHQGVTEAMADAGQPLATDYDNEYGRNKPNEWRGVPSARAL